jgi:hypothetical protein
VTRRAGLLALVIFWSATAPPARAQGPADLVARGVQAYQNLDYDSAATLLRGALAAAADAGVPDNTRARALVYLGATEVFRGQRDSAMAAFRRLVLADPRYRLDQLIFPPEVSNLFAEVRLGTKAVSVVVAPRTEIRGPGDRLVVRLFATSSHEVAAALTRANGTTLRVLYRGAIGDSLEILWDGRDSAGVRADSGRLELRIASRASGIRATRLVQVPLDLRLARRDTVPWPRPPADSLFRPEHAAGGSGLGVLARGGLAAVAVLALPRIVAPSADASGARFAVSGAIAVSGLYGLLVERRARPLPVNIAANRAIRDGWRRGAEDVRARNEALRRDVALVITAGRPVATESQ